MQGALTRYRVIAVIVGTALLVLTAGVVVHVVDGDHTWIKIAATVHGYLYIVYLVLGFDLCRRARWSLPRTALVLLAGIVPFLTFVAERRVTKELRPLVSAG